MVEWLDKRGVEFPDAWRKRGHSKKLKELVKETKEKDPNYNAEVMAKKYPEIWQKFVHLEEI